MSDILEKELFGLLDPLQKIKFVQRSGWLERNLNADTIASHVMDTLLTGWYMAKKENADEDTVIHILLIHDLVMAYMDDVTPKSGKYDKKVDYEEESFKQVTAKAPEILRHEYEKLWRQFQDQSTIEARIAREADKIATLFQGECYEISEKRDIYSEHLGYYEKVFTSDSTSKTGREIYRALKNRHEERMKNLAK